MRGVHVRRQWLIAIFLAYGVIDVHAQAPPRGLIEVAATWATNDAQRPERFNYEIERAVYSIGGSLFVVPRVGIGGEWVRLGAVTAPGGSPRDQITEEQREHAWLGTVRLRALTTPSASIDLVGGAGLLRQHRETLFRFNPSDSLSVDTTSMAYVVRAELPVALARHVAVAPYAALYWLRREDSSSNVFNLSRTTSSARAAFGAAGMVAW